MASTETLQRPREQEAAKAPEAQKSAKELFEAAVAEARGSYPRIANEVDDAAKDAGVPSRLTDITLGISARWADKSDDEIRAKAEKINGLGEHPAIKELVEKHGPLDVEAPIDGLRMDTTERLVRLHVQQSLFAMNGSGPPKELRPDIIKASGEMAIYAVDQMKDQLNRDTRWGDVSKDNIPNRQRKLLKESLSVSDHAEYRKNQRPVKATSNR